MNQPILPPQVDSHDEQIDREEFFAISSPPDDFLAFNSSPILHQHEW